MKLLRVTLSGFKSFADKTTIDFSEGMTVIVGPNGCGKSNISDAVRWVLGEQNVRNIRGQKAEDIIFSGSESRAPKNGAEVTLVLDNSARELALDTAEVAITRRLLRNGDSDFQLNKRSCRLKDIQELLAPTGLGKGSLAIIGQNRVDQVLTARPEERRLIFEDVAGITLYRMRKTEGLRKLEKTAENMERVKDMVALLDEELVPLKEEAEKAKIYKALMEEKKAIDGTMSLLKLTSVRRMIARYENEFLSLKDESALWAAKLAAASLAKEKLEKDQLAHQEEMRSVSSRLAEAQQKMESLRGDFRVKEETLRYVEEKLKSLADDEEDQKEAEAELAEEIENAKEELAEARAQLSACQEALSAKEEEKASLARSLAAAEEAYAEMVRISREKLAEKEKLSQQVLHKKEDLARISSEIASWKGEGGEMEASLSRAEAALASGKEEAEQKKKELAAVEAEGAKDSRALKAAQDERFRLVGEEGKLASALAGVRSKRDFLVHADKEYASFSRTTKTIMENKERFGEAIHGALGELLRVPEKYTDAAEAALGGQISYIVTDTTASAGRIISWLKERNLGRTTFYPLESMHPRYANRDEQMAAREKGICGIASELFSCHPMYKDLVETLLGRTLIAENLEAARAAAKKYNYRLRIVTLDGQLVNAGGSMTGGSMKKKENTYFGRKKEIEELTRQEEAWKEKIAACQKAKKEKESLCDGLAEKVSEERETWQSLKTALAALTARLGEMEKSLAERKRQWEEKQRAGEGLLLAEKETKDAVKQMEEALLAYADIPEVGDNEAGEALRKKLDAKNGEILELHVALTKAEEAVNFGKRMEKEREEARQEQIRERALLEKEKAESEKSKADLMRGLSELKGAFAKAEGEWQAIRQTQSAMENRTDDFTIRQKEADENWRKTQAKTSAIEQDMAEKKGRIDYFKSQENDVLAVMKERGLSFAAAEALRVPGSMEELTKKEKDLTGRIAALGNFNHQGEEAYQKQLERRAFYENQINDLNQAREGLETIISDMDKTMETQFAEAFRAINVEFGRIMQIMFHGGSAKLELTDEAHPLDGGVEMYLQLPGKRRQPLTLMSGGERALTVIALLISFMAYRPAPFCFVDEIDAALDDVNVERYSRMIGDYKKKSQFIVISHRKKTMEFADTLQGVTMGEKGVSSLITVKMGDYVS